MIVGFRPQWDLHNYIQNSKWPEPFENDDNDDYTMQPLCMAMREAVWLLLIAHSVDQPVHVMLRFSVSMDEIVCGDAHSEPPKRDPTGVKLSAQRLYMSKRLPTQP